MDIWNIIFLLFQIISALGGFGVLFLIYDRWKNSKKKVEIVSSYGTFEELKVDNKLVGISITTNVVILNETANTISITDAVGMLKQTSGGKIHSEKPFLSDLPQTIRSGESVNLSLSFDFRNINNLKSIVRLSPVHKDDMHLYYNQGVPELFINEETPNWDKEPLYLWISIHINGKDIISERTPVFDVASIKYNRFLYGSLGTITILDLENKFRKMI